MTLNDLLMVTAAPRLRVTVTLTRTLTARVDVDSSDMAQWDELTSLYGGFRVREVRPENNALCISLTPDGRARS